MNSMQRLADSTFSLALGICRPIYRGSCQATASIAQGIRFARMTPLETMTLPILGAIALEAFGSSPQGRTFEQAAGNALINGSVIGVLGLAAIGTVAIHDWYMGLQTVLAVPNQPFVIQHQPRASFRQGSIQSQPKIGG